MELVSIYPIWVYFLCLLLAALASYLFHRRDKRLIEFPKATVLLLTALRFAGLFSLLVLLTAPLVKYFSKTIESPIIILAQDNSQSMISAKDSSFVVNGFAEKVNALRKKFEGKYRIENILFDETVNQGLNPDFSGKITNYENLIEEVESQYLNQNVAGMIVLSDGIYNEGNNPAYLSSILDFSLYTVALGDTVEYKDAKIQQIRNNELAFLGNDFPVEVDLNFQKAKNEKFRVSIVGSEGEVFSKELQINSNDFTQTISANLEAKSAGLQQYKVIVSSSAGERNLLNNTLNFYIDVLDGRQKILLLAANPHPDVSAIRQSINRNINYELEVAYIKEFNKKLNEYDLLIMHQSILNPDQAIDARMKHVINASIPVLLIGDGWKLLGLQFGIKPFNDRTKSGKNDVFPTYNSAFSLFTISNGLEEQLSKFPPLLAARSTLNRASPNTVMLNQKIGAVSTQFPLLEFFNKNGRKIGRWYGENLWKWSMNDFVDNQNTKNFDELISKIVQFLAVKADRSFFRLKSNNEYFENENIVFDAQLFNQSYELVNDPEVSLKLIDEEGQEYNYQFNRNSASYKLSIASLKAGKYNYFAETSFQGKKLEEKGSLTVKALQLEQMESVANHEVLYQFAHKSGGELFYPEDLESIYDKIDKREDVAAVSYQNEEVEDIINLRWIFYIILGLLSLEWFIRKRKGAY